MLGLRQKFISGLLFLEFPKINFSFVLSLYVKTLDTTFSLKISGILKFTLLVWLWNNIYIHFYKLQDYFWKKQKTKLTSGFQNFFLRHKMLPSNLIVLVEAQNMKHIKCLIYLANNREAAHETLAILDFKICTVFLFLFFFFKNFSFFLFDCMGFPFCSCGERGLLFCCDMQA